MLVALKQGMNDIGFMKFAMLWGPIYVVYAYMLYRPRNWKCSGSNKATNIMGSVKYKAIWRP